MKLIRRLQDREQDKLRELGKTRDDIRDKISYYKQQVHTLQLISQEYLQQGAPHALLHANRLGMHQQLQPMIKDLTRQIGIYEVQLQQVEQQWKAQLGRYQGMKWYADKKDMDARLAADKAEQKAMDDLASRPRLSF